MMQSDFQWFIAREGKQHGPVSDAEMRKLMELGHLRPSDLVWRQGFADWKPAAAIFPPPQSAPPAAAPPAPRAALGAAPASAAPMAAPAPSPNMGGSLSPGTRGPGPNRPDTVRRPASITRTGEPRQPAASYAQPHASAPPEPMSLQPFDSEPSPPRRGKFKKALIFATVIAVLGAGAWLMLGSSKPPLDPIAAQDALNAGKIAALNTKTPLVTKAVGAGSAANPKLDAHLQKIPAWQIVKRDFTDWYEARMKQAADLAAENKDQAEIDKILVTELVKLRRENAKDALAAPADNLKAMAIAFRTNLMALEKIGIPACYAFISRGESIGVVVEILQEPGKGAEINNQIVTVFEAVQLGKKEQIKRESPQKPDYDVLAAELGKLGWTQGDMQLFANAPALSRAPPEKVCHMVQDWFKAHLDVKDAAIQERLLFETLKPVVGG